MNVSAMKKLNEIRELQIKIRTMLNDPILDGVRSEALEQVNRHERKARIALVDALDGQ